MIPISFSRKRNTESLGMQLVSSLVMQLDATLQLSRNGGTEFTIRQNAGAPGVPTHSGS